MTQPEPAQTRHTADSITSDALDALYREIDTLRAVCDSNKRAYVGAVKHAWEVEERAKQAEAALNAVRAELDALNSQTAGLNPYAMAGRRDAVARVRAALDAHTNPKDQPT
jgi:uncharacterized coiled-coil DUF342 family protein